MKRWDHELGRLTLVGLLALVLLLPASCGPRAARGAGIGAAVGAVTGAVIGHQSGHGGEGAVIGAAAGATVGGLIGHRLDKQAEELAAVAQTERTEQGVIVTLSSNKIHFDVNSSTVKPDSRQTLVELANVLKNYPEDIIAVVGHTDADGAADYNLKLSEMRAQAVADVLIANGLPIASNETVDGKTLNRRVELSITVDESKVPKE